ncbi:MAG: hypothetical protein M3Q97_07660 [Bacteroidota bacterium]|nr:hypothetical protein [Bacteroidota bacterium]
MAPLRTLPGTSPDRQGTGINPGRGNQEWDREQDGGAKPNPQWDQPHEAPTQEPQPGTAPATRRIGF